MSHPPTAANLPTRRGMFATGVFSVGVMSLLSIQSVPWYTEFENNVATSGCSRHVSEQPLKKTLRMCRFSGCDHADVTHQLGVTEDASGVLRARVEPGFGNPCLLNDSNGTCSCHRVPWWSEVAFHEKQASNPPETNQGWSPDRRIRDPLNICFSLSTSMWVTWHCVFRQVCSFKRYCYLRLLLLVSVGDAANTMYTSRRCAGSGSASERRSRCRCVDVDRRP